MNSAPHDKKPPRWADRFLEWYCDPSLLEEIQGDAHELFHRTATQNEGRARRLFAWNVIRFFRLKNIRRRKAIRQSSIPAAMLKSYFITGFRNILRNVVPSSINIVGLAIAVGCAVTIYLLLDSYYHLDKFHRNGDRLYLVMNEVKGAEESEKWANSPYLLGPALKDNAAVETAVRIEMQEGTNVRYNDLVFSERLWFVDRDFFDVFSFNVKSGDPHTLRDKNHIIITESMATKYFGNDGAVGKILSLKFSSGQKEEFTVGAVAEKISDNSSMFFNFLLSTEKLEDLKLMDTESWKTFTNATYVLLKPGHQPGELLPSFDQYKKVQNLATLGWPIQRFELIPMREVAVRSYDLVNSLSWSNHPAAMIALGVIASFLVLLACFNYMNVAVASVSTRLKEIGIRKVTGGSRKDIIFQFLIENIVLCAMAIIVGTAIAYFFMVPGFNSLYPIKTPFTFSSASAILFFFGGLLLFIALVSGAYPAMYVASFNAISILKGKEKFGSKSKLSKVLLGLQFTLSFTTIVACLVFASSSDYFENIDWGYDHAQNIVIPVQSREQYLALKDRVATNKNIISYAGSESQVSYRNLLTTIQYNEQTINLSRFAVDFGYMETMNLRLKAGRFFDPAIESDKTESVVVNESFVKKMGWENPLRQSFVYDSVKRYVIGVISDFHNNDFYRNVDPVVFNIAKEDDFRYLVVKVEAGTINATVDFLKKSWKEIAPDDPYRGFMQDEVFERFFQANRSNNKILYFVSGVALLLSCMGLYGLVSYNLTRRIKEFSIRKVFGASLLTIFRLMNGDYIWIVLIAFVAGAPLGFYLMTKMLFMVYPYPIPVELWPFLVTIAVMIMTVAATISTQLNRVAHENPTETLRSE